MKEDFSELVSQLKAMSPAHRLRVAADLLEEGQSKVALRLIELVSLDVQGAMNMEEVNRRPRVRG